MNATFFLLESMCRDDASAGIATTNVCSRDRPRARLMTPTAEMSIHACSEAPVMLQPDPRKTTHTIPEM